MKQALRTMDSKTVLTCLRDALLGAAKVNRSVQYPPAAILWTDKDGAWLSVVERLRSIIPGLVVFGAYAPEQRRGPAIWIKAAIAGKLPDIPMDAAIPIVYLPSVSRADLRAIETCPKDLQPLAELQYRGVFWSQANAKDWTVGAFLASKNGGLGLDVAQDKATQEALNHALQAGVLLDRSVSELQGRSINEEWLLSLMAPNPIRDLLQWMNGPDATRQLWGDVLWGVFVKRCKSDFSFDPVADGILGAAERLAKGEGKWAEVWTLYREAFSGFPHIHALLAKVQPPQLGLFPDLEGLARYPQINDEHEASLRHALSNCAGMDASQARSAVIAAEKEHSIRRGWLWSRMGLSPLAMALEHLAEVAHRSATVPIGQTPNELAASYQQNGWQVDQAALRALASVSAKNDFAAISAALRVMYLPWLEDAAQRLQAATERAQGLGSSQAQDAGESAVGICFVFVDGLRYDVAKRLEQRLSSLGTTDLTARWTSLPSVTASGKAWCSPVAGFIMGGPGDVDFEPISTHNFRKLLVEHGVQLLSKHEMGDQQGCAWTDAGDLDHYGHEHGIRLARDMETQLNQIVERINELSDAGWKRIRIVTDHGWLLMPGGLPKSELPKHQTETRWGRCAVLKNSAHGAALTFGWDWCKDVQVAYAPGVTSFIANVEYAHGGISLQECLVPVLQLECVSTVSPAAVVTIQSVTWRGLRCTVVVDGTMPGQQVDIRTKAALASSSLADKTKLLEGGKASLAVTDDQHIGTVAVVVVLAPDGEVLQKQTTTVGEK